MVDFLADRLGLDPEREDLFLQNLPATHKHVEELLKYDTPKKRDAWLARKAVAKSAFAQPGAVGKIGLGVDVSPIILKVIQREAQLTKKTKKITGWAWPVEAPALVGVVDDPPSLTAHLAERMDELQEELNDLNLPHRIQEKSKGKYRPHPSPREQILWIELKALHEHWQKLRRKYPHLARKRQYCEFNTAGKRCGEFVAWTPRTVGSKFCDQHRVPASRKTRNQRYYQRDIKKSRRMHREYKRRYRHTS
jgi:hypothetical protein